MKHDLFSVTELNQAIKLTFEADPDFRNLFVRGEISNYKPHPSGHHYFTLKDAGAAISAVMFKSDAAKLRFRLQSGMNIIAHGRISSFPKTGQVQLYVSDLMPDGAGALHLAYEQLRDKLYAEGLFDEKMKRPLPLLPETVALVTARSGAAIHDMLHILSLRWPVAKILVFPALVQGANAPDDLCRALTMVNAHGKADVVIVGRGGGSLEDLWAFNSEKVARAIRKSRIPVVSAIGHEPDVTIADFAADMRAPTPSAAAELITPNQVKLLADLNQLSETLQLHIQHKFHALRLKLAQLQERLMRRNPSNIITGQRLLLTHVCHRLYDCTPQVKVAHIRAYIRENTRELHRLMHKNISVKANALSIDIAALDALSPLKVLARGYAVAFNQAGRIVIDSADVQTGEYMNVQFAKGSVGCKVLSIEQAGRKMHGCAKEAEF